VSQGLLYVETTNLDALMYINACLRTNFGQIVIQRRFNNGLMRHPLSSFLLLVRDKTPKSVE